MQQNGKALEYAYEDVCYDKEVVLTAVEKDGSTLFYASSALKNDKDVVLATVQKDRDALQHASKALQKDHEILSWARLTKGKRLWRKCKERYCIRRILEFWEQETMKAMFDENGDARMEGQGAKRAREDFETDFN